MTSEDFTNLCRMRTEDYQCVEQKDQDIGGGRITYEEIDRINTFQNYDKVVISGLKQDTFEYFIQTQAYKFKSILFFKNKLVEDWSLLSTLKDVELIGYYHNQRITRLWDMSGNESLTGLFISDFTRLHSLDGIKKAPKLERLCFSDAVWNTGVLSDIKALENSRLKEFTFGAKKILEEDVTIYTKMPNLEMLDFPSNLYRTEQIAWLVAMLPNVKGYSLRPYIKFDNGTLSEKDVLICGKRKPFLSSKQDVDTIDKYVSKFEQLVYEYRKGIKTL